MAIYYRATSNAERQRQFRRRNPGYYKKYYVSKRARVEAAKRQAQALMLAQAEADTQLARAAAPPLMLPAPVEPVVIPGMTTIPATPADDAPAPIRLPVPPAMKIAA